MTQPTHEDLKEVWRNFVDRNTDRHTTVIFSEEMGPGEDGPRPPVPFITLQIISGPTTIGGTANLRPQTEAEGGVDNSKFWISEMEGYTISMQAFGHGSHDSLRKVRVMLSNPDEVALFKKAANVGIVERGQVQNLTEILTVGFERRATLDVTFMSSANYSIDPSTIERVRVNGTIEDEIGNVRVVPEIDVSKP